MSGLAIIAGSLLLGCGGASTPEPVPYKPEDAPAVKEKESMDYYRNQMKKPAGARK